MQDNFISKLSPSVRIVVLLLLILCLLLAKSIYLILFIATLTLILIVTTNKKVNLYVNTAKKLIITLSFFLIIYIIIFREYDIFNIGLLACKSIIILNLITIFILNINFRSMHEGLNGIFLPLKILKINVEKFSFDITLSFYFIKFLFESKEKIKYVQKITVKNYIFSRLLYAINQLEKMQDNLKIKFYKLNYKKSSFLSKIVMLLFIFLFVICIFKEVV